MTVYTGTAPETMYADYLIDLSIQSQDLNNNLTRLSYRIYLKSKGGGYPFSSGQHALKLIVDGKTIVNTTSSYKVPAGGEFVLSTGTFSVVHNADGTKTLPFNSTFASYHGTCSVSGSMVLPNLARASTLKITDNSGNETNNNYVGDTLRLYVNKASTAYTHSISYTMKTDFGSIAKSVDYSESQTYTSYVFPDSFVENYFATIDTRTVTFSLRTYNGSQLIGSEEKNITLKVPSFYNPYVSNIEVIENNSTIKNFGLDGFYQNLSTYNVRMTAEARGGASITNYKIEMAGRTWNTNTSSVYLPSVATSGTAGVKVTVTDSRGRTGSLTKNITVLPYALPSIDSFTAKRRLDTKLADAYLKATHQTMGSPDKNQATIKVFIKAANKTERTMVYEATSNVSYFNENILLGTTLSDEIGYEVTVTISDKFNANTAVTTLAAGDIAMVLDGETNSIGIGKAPTLPGRDGLDVKGKIFSEGKQVLTGDVSEFLKTDSDIFMKNVQSIDGGKDLNNYFEAGFYSVRNPNNLPSGAGAYGTLIVSRADLTLNRGATTDSVQLYIDNNNEMYVRNSVDKSNSWTSWKKASGSDTTLSSYSNGYVLKHSNGLMEQVITADLTSTEKAFTSGSAGFYGGKTKVVYFHEPFSTVYGAVANCYSSGYVQGFVGEVYTNRANIRLYSPNSVSASALSLAKVSMIAKGRWD